MGSNKDWRFLTAPRGSVEQRDLDCFKSHLVAKSGTFLAQPDIIDFTRAEIYDVTTIKQAPAHRICMWVDTGLATSLAANPDCSGTSREWNPGTWVPNPCYWLGGDLYMTVFNDEGLLLYDVVKKKKKEDDKKEGQVENLPITIPILTPGKEKQKQPQPQPQPQPGKEKRQPPRQRPPRPGIRLRPSASFWELNIRLHYEAYKAFAEWAYTGMYWGTRGYDLNQTLLRLASYVDSIAEEAGYVTSLNEDLQTAELYEHSGEEATAGMRAELFSTLKRLRKMIEEGGAELNKAMQSSAIHDILLRIRSPEDDLIRLGLDNADAIIQQDDDSSSSLSLLRDWEVDAVDWLESKTAYLANNYVAIVNKDQINWLKIRR